jgi:hypothetical protein
MLDYRNTFPKREIFIWRIRHNEEMQSIFEYGSEQLQQNIDLDIRRNFYGNY